MNDNARVYPVNLAGILYGITLGSRAAKAVHADSIKHFCCFRVIFY